MIIHTTVYIKCDECGVLTDGTSRLEKLDGKHVLITRPKAHDEDGILCPGNWRDGIFVTVVEEPPLAPEEATPYTDDVTTD